jgi:hypothetical protein
MFDEMSIRENFHFQKFDSIESFKDLRSRRGTHAIAEHLVIYIPCHLHQKRSNQWLATVVMEALSVR